MASSHDSGPGSSRPLGDNSDRTEAPGRGSALTSPSARGHDHALGDGGPVLVLFGDYEDPASAEAHRAVMELRERWDGFTYVWRQLPVGELHPNANGAALAAEGAAAQDEFWAY